MIKKLALSLSLALIIVGEAVAQCGCTFTIPMTQFEVNGTTMGIKPGDVICLPGGGGTSNSKLFKNIHGTKDQPVIIKNCNGKVYIEKPTTAGFGIDFTTSSHFRLTGTGDAAHTYGIEIKGGNQGVQIGNGSTDFEVDHIRVYGTGYAGFAIKTNPGCDPSTWRENYTMYNVKVHDNYSSETTGEGYYIGNSHYHFAVDKTCNGVPIKVWEHLIRNAEIYNNIAENTDRDGLQVGAVAEGAKIYNNRVRNFGFGDPDHTNGIQINPGTSGVVYNNVAIDGAGWGLQCVGNGVTLYNNLAANCLLGGVFVDDRAPTPGVSFNIFNNTLIKNGRYGIYFLSVVSVNNKFYNNIIVSDGSATFKYVSKYSTAVLDAQNNLQTADINQPQFEDVATHNYKIKAGSPAINQGRDVSSFGVSFDLANLPRPSNGQYDQGAYEVQASSVAANAGPDKNINLPTTTVVLTGSGFSPNGAVTYTWTKKSGGVGTLANANTSALTVTGLALGTYVFQLEVKDGLGQIALDEATVNVLAAAANQVPTANATADKTVTLPENTLTLNGAGIDLDGAIVKYTWTKVSGGTVTMTNADKPSMSLSALTQGVYQFQLTVEDDDGATASDIVKVTVNGTATNVPPTANAGADKIITLPTSTVVVTGTATDSDGTISTLLWERRSGPATCVLTNQNTLILTVTALTQGSYVFRLTVTDNLGGVTYDEMKVDVLAGANQSPTANAGTDKTITLPTNTINLTGTGNDPDGSIASYLWTYVSGPGAPTLVNSTSATVTLNALVAGVYTMGFRVTDNAGATGYDEVKVTVNAVATNQTPTANAGVDKTITLPTNTLVLNGSGTDPDGTIVSYSWSKKSGPFATLTNAATKDLSLSGLVAGVYVFTLRVTDNGTAFDDDDVSVTVLPATVNLSPVANAGGNKYLTLPTNSIILNGVGADTDGTIVTYVWTQEQGPPAAFSGQNTANLSLTALIEGEYLFKLTVTDDDGASTSDFAAVIVSSGNLPPIVDAGEDQLIVLPTSSTTVNGSATDPEGATLTYQWSQVSGPPAGALPATPTLTLNALVQGTYVFSLEADDGTASATDEVTVTVLAASANQIPLVNAGSDQVIFLPTNSTAISGNASDADGTITTYAWTKTSGPAFTPLNDNTATLTATGLATGVYVFRLTVTDNDGASVFDEVKVTVNAAATNQPPIVNAGPNQIIQLPTNVATLSGSAIDNDGSITGYAWTKISGPTCGLANANTPTLTVTALLEGTYVFRLTATDNGTATGFAEARVIVFPSTVNQAPQADAGQNQTLTLPTNTTSLVGAAFDADGTIITYAWTKVSGPASSSITNPSNQVTALTSLVQGTYVFRLTVTDNLGTSGADEVTITVNDGVTNSAPVADAGGNQAISLPTTSILLFGTGSDSDGSITSYLWTKISGGVESMSNTTSPTLTVTGLAPGVYRFRLRVTDNNGATNDDIATILVNDVTANQPPVANAGGDKSITLPTSSITIAGGGTDNDGTIASFAWEKTIGGAATLTNATTKNLFVTGLAEGLYVFRLTVTDDDGYTDFDEMTLRVLPENSNLAPLVNAGLDTTIVLPNNSVTFTPDVVDPDGTITVYFWSKVSGPTMTFANPDIKNAIAQNLVEGIYVFRLTAIDDDNTSTSDLIQVNVLPVGTNAPPTVSAGADQVITLPIDNIEIIGTVTDPDGIQTILWTQVSGPSWGTPTGLNTERLSLTGLTEGTYEFEITGTDVLGAVASDRVRLIVNPIPPNQPPLVEAGENASLTLPMTVPIEFQGSATDSDDGVDPATYQWTLRSGPAGAVVDFDAATVTTNKLKVNSVDTEGLYIFRLTVADLAGDTGFDEVLLSATNNNTTDRLPPLSYAGADTVLVLPDNTIEIVGNGIDPDGFIESYIWEKVSGPNTPFENPGNTSLLLTDAVAGEYVFRLTVVDNDSLSGFDDITILVTPKGEGIIIPKIVTPNGDQYNQTWKIGNVEAIDGCLVSIFTRHGKKVFETTSYDNTWDGTASNGQILHDGDYYYVIKCDGTILASGGVRIIR